MNERQMQFRVGVVMLATMIIGTILATLNGPIPRDLLPWGVHAYRIAIELPQAPGVGLNTPVRKNGLLIGRVSEIEDLDNGVIVKVDIDGDRRLLTSHVPHVRTSVLGDATIDFVSEPTAAPPQQLTDGARIPGVVDPNPFDSIAKLGDLQDDVQQTMQALARAGNEVADVAARVDEAFGSETEEGRIKRLLDTTERAMLQLGNAAAAFNDILGENLLDEPATQVVPPANRRIPPATQGVPRTNQGAMPSTRIAASLANFQQPDQAEIVIQVPTTRDRLKQALNELPDAVRDFRVTMQELRVVLDSANKNFRDLEGFTQPLGQNGPRIVNSILETTEGLDRMVEELNVFSRALSSREGTLGQLIHDRQVYENLNRLIHNANQVVLQVNDITLRLRPVVNDARIFMDKVAREPGRVVTGGLNPSPIK
ncbi:MAG TPA: MlaD family protein [Lacipirellulaceae bacterium]|nr:MlaD family protein [Lacipirellulaceae bacterium]